MGRCLGRGAVGTGHRVSSQFRFLRLPILRVPKLPVAGWEVLFDGSRGEVPSLSDLPHFVFTTSGRAAIWLALQELGVGQGDEVLVPTYHCPTMVSPIVAIGARPVFYPIDSNGLPLIESIEQFDLRRAKALIAVHYFGVLRRLQPVRSLCDRHGMALVEDCAHAYFGQLDGHAVGAIGDFAIASLPKFFPVPEGGCLASNDRPIGRILEPRGWLASMRQVFDTVERGASYDRFEPIGFALRGAFRMKDLLRGRRPGAGDAAISALGDVTDETAMPPFDADAANRAPAAIVRIIGRRANRHRIAATRQANYRLLSSLLGAIPGASVLDPNLPEGSVPYVLPLWVDEPERSYQPLREAGVPIFRWDVLWPNVPAIPGDWGRRWAHHVFQLGCHQDLGETDIRRIASIVEGVIGSVQ